MSSVERARMMREAALALAVSVLYFAAAKLGLSMAFASEQVTLVWPPSGIALAAILRLGPRVWPGIALGALAANATAGEHMLAVAVGISVGNTLEAVFAAWLLGRSGFDSRLERMRDAFAFVMGAVLASPVIAATIGVGSLCLLGAEPWSRFDHLWLLWWMGDAIGIVLVAPPLLVWSRRPRGRMQLDRALEAAALAIALALVGIRIFAWRSTSEIEPFLYLVYPFVIWTALRFQQRGITLAVLFIAIVAVVGTLQGLGPFAKTSPNDSLFLLQTFMAVVAITGLAFGASTSERAAAAMRLAESHGILKAVAEGTTDTVFVKDLQGRYLMINSAGARSTGKSVEEILGRDDREIFSPETAAEIRRRDERIMREGSTATFEERVTVSGETRTFLSTKGPYLDEKGAIIGLIGIARDITELKAAEDERAELLEREQALRAAADRSNRQKDEFLGLLGHELRNPLAPIRNGLEILRQDSSDKTIGWALEVMERQVHHLSRLVDDLLDVSRITSGRIELRRELTDLRPVLERSIEVSDPFLRSRGHRLKLSLPTEPLRIVADVTRLEQVFVNLLNNSAKYTEPGGRIEVEARRQGDDALVFVRDTGRGISKELLPRVFDLFTQADSSLARSEGGLGVGLALVRKLIELHSGTVSASSEGVGRGSEFRVRLPLASARIARPLRPPERLQSQGRSLKVLLVEDNADSSRSLAKLLSLFGHEVEIVEDGPSAVKAAEAFDPAVVLLDIGLPGLNGYEVAKQLRSRGSKAVLVSLTGYGRESDRAKSAEAGCDHHLVKPVEPETLKKLFASIAPGLST